MNEPDPTPLDPDLRELLTLERSPELPVPGAKDRVWERVQESLIPGPVSPPTAEASTAAATSSGAALPVGALVLGAAVLAAVLILPEPTEEAEPSAPNVHVRSLLPPSTPAVVPAPPTVPAPVGEAPVHAPEPEIEIAPVVPAAAPVQPRTAPAKRPQRDAGDRLEEERRLLDEGRKALRDGRAGAALDAVAAHRTRHPRGKLVEEREALHIRALDRLGRLDQARAAALRFLSRFPSSIHRDAVERIVGSKEP